MSATYTFQYSSRIGQTVHHRAAVSCAKSARLARQTHRPRRLHVANTVPPPKNELEVTVRRKRTEIEDRLERLGPEGAEFKLRTATPAKPPGHQLLRCLVHANSEEQRTALLVEVARPPGEKTPEGLTSICEYLVARGADGLAVATDAEDSPAGLEDLEAAAALSVPVLRLDWIIHPIQLTDTTACGATAVTLVNCILSSATSRLVNMCGKLSLDAVVEVVNLEEVKAALESDAVIFGLNISVGLSLGGIPGFKQQMSLRMLDKLPAGAMSVVGVTTVEEAQTLAAAGASAVLLKKEALAGLEREEVAQLVYEMKAALANYPPDMFKL